MNKTRVLPILLAGVLGCVFSCVRGVESTPAEPKTMQLPTTKVNEKDSAMMVWVPAGEFLRGNTAGVGASDENPQQSIFLAGFWIYQYEVTVAQYRAFCAATGRALPYFPKPKIDWGATSNYSWTNKSGWADPSLQQHPIVNVTWYDAKAYADWAGVALPTEAQWEKAARGTDGRNYPWGGVATTSDQYNGWDPTKCANDMNCTRVGISTWPVGSFPAGVSPYGAYDMAGNVWEWCLDWYQTDYYAKSPSSNPTGPVRGVNPVLRGGSWYYFNNTSTRCAYRNYGGLVSLYGNFGFRCISTAPGP